MLRGITFSIASGIAQAMILRTEILPTAAPFRLLPADGVVIAGSCFAVQMADRLQALRFRVCEASHGILYHPDALARSLSDVLSGSVVEYSDLILHEGRWHSMAHHGNFSDSDPAVALARMNEALERTAQALPRARLLLLTLGTAHAWVYRDTGAVAGNCHRLPVEAFERRLSPHDEITEVLGKVLRELLNRYPGLHVALSVSPVRHIREGLQQNQLSKAHLLVAAHALAASHERITYFPAWEIMMDDLRDYRFYERDMVHPNELARDYIWERFSAWCMDPHTLALLAEVEQLSRILHHRPSEQGREAYTIAAGAAEERIAALIASATKKP